MQPKNVTVVLRAFEQVSFPEFNISNVKAKIDTGAYTGSLHCTKIVEKQTENGRVLEFSPFDHPEIVVQEEDFILSQVKSSNGVNQSRYFIKTQIVIRGKQYPIMLSLADRSEMRWPVLIGRRFLRRHNFVVDVSARKDVS